jgi:hypothetical protein
MTGCTAQTEETAIDSEPLETFARYPHEIFTVPVRSGAWSADFKIDLFIGRTWTGAEVTVNGTPVNVAYAGVTIENKYRLWRFQSDPSCPVPYECGGTDVMTPYDPGSSSEKRGTFSGLERQQVRTEKNTRLPDQTDKSDRYVDLVESTITLSLNFGKVVCTARINSDFQGSHSCS